MNERAARDARLRRFDRLPRDVAEEVLRAAARTAGHDGAAPLSEAAELAVRHSPGGTTHLLAQSTDALPGPELPGPELPAREAVGREVVGYAQLRGQDAQVEGFVTPTARAKGWGTLLGEAVVAHPGRPPSVTAWAHGDLPGAAALAQRFGALRARQLWQMRRPADHALPAVHVPDGVRLRSFAPGRDDEDWLALNAAAFSDHPEQGRWTAEDFAHRLAEPWFDPEGFILAHDTGSGELIAAHWTKTQIGPDGLPVGEVYVVSVAPGARGRGLGRLVTIAGLTHLSRLRPQGQPLKAVELYTDGDNAAAVALYGGLGFERVAVHAAYTFPAVPDKLEP